MKAVIFGAGNIGRGFIGVLLAESGYAVTFIDVSQAVVDELNQAHAYPIRTVSNEGHEDKEITGVNAIHASAEKEVAEAIATADILAVSVGANALPKIAPNLLAGLRRRWARTDTSLNILLCENLPNVNHIMEELLKEQMSQAEKFRFYESVGLVKTAIGRMVPVQTAKMQDGNPLRICVERYAFLPVDKDSIKGAPPKIETLIPFSPFNFYLRRKLFLHNMGHAICAYLGLYTRKEFIYEAIEDANIHLIVSAAMRESAVALSEEYGVPLQEILFHVDDLLWRFANRSLEDTCERVGADCARKLAPSDRLAGAMLFCKEKNVQSIGIAMGTAGAIYQYLKESGQCQCNENAASTLKKLSELEPECDIGKMVMDFYRLYCCEASPKQLYQAIQAKKNQMIIEVV